MKRRRERSHDEQQQKQRSDICVPQLPSLSSSTVDQGRQPFGRCTTTAADTYEKLGRRLGQGTYGVVYKAKDRRDGRIVALKRCVLWNETEESEFGFPITCLREIEALRICQSCPYVVHLLDVAVSKSSSVFLVFEYCEHDLADIVDRYYHKHQKSPFTEPAVKTLMLHLLRALSFLHQRHWIHRDVKLSNLLYSNHCGILKLADFGLSRHYFNDHSNNTNKLTPNVASLWYRPPEVMLLLEKKNSGCCHDSYTQSIDLWAAGCIFMEILLGFHPLCGKTEMEQIQLIGKWIGVPDEDTTTQKSLSTQPLLHGVLNSYMGSRKYRILDKMTSLSEAGRQLFTYLLQWDPELRWTSDQGLGSPYFYEFPTPLSEPQMPRF